MGQCYCYEFKDSKGTNHKGAIDLKEFVIGSKDASLLETNNLD